MEESLEKTTYVSIFKVYGYKCKILVWTNNLEEIQIEVFVFGVNYHEVEFANTDNLGGEVQRAKNKVIEFLEKRETPDSKETRARNKIDKILKTMFFIINK